ncbi:hypothetical protein [Aestuariispira ectoiniformans]|uniref:hypothetical protein n=1 Tax=Aestuariispira ectoiniformans TaxID=2775080 RepID=UPI00223B8BEE|nr:hypothetical protein [Aestuariispira ectoiniformans]
MNFGEWIEAALISIVVISFAVFFKSQMDSKEQNDNSDIGNIRASIERFRAETPWLINKHILLLFLSMVIGAIAGITIGFTISALSFKQFAFPFDMWFQSNAFSWWWPIAGAVVGGIVCVMRQI